MMSEQEKYLDALQKTYELKKALDDLNPESRVRLFEEVTEAAGFQQLILELRKTMQSNR